MTLKTSHGTQDISLVWWDKHSLQLCALSAFLIQVQLKMILLAWNGVNSSRVVFLEGQQTTVISEGQNTFIWPCWGRLGGQNRTQFDSYYGRLAAVHFKTTFIWSGWDVQVWNFLRAPYKCRAPLPLQWPSPHGSSSSRDTLSSWRQFSMQSSLARFRNRFNFSSIPPPPKKSAEGTFSSKLVSESSAQMACSLP